MSTGHDHERIFGVSSVSKAYGGRVALAPITLEVMSGERVAIVGPSGSGKTTLLHLLAGVIRPDSGDITTFAEVLIGADTNGVHRAQADMNCDGAADGGDLAAFVEAVLAP